MLVCESSRCDVVFCARYTVYDIHILDHGRENAKEKETEQDKAAEKNGGTLPAWPRLPCLLHVVVAPLPLLLACSGDPPLLAARMKPEPSQNKGRTKPE